MFAGSLFLSTPLGQCPAYFEAHGGCTRNVCQAEGKFENSHWALQDTTSPTGKSVYDISLEQRDKFFAVAKFVMQSVQSYLSINIS